MLERVLGRDGLNLLEQFESVRFHFLFFSRFLTHCSTRSLNDLDIGSALLLNNFLSGRVDRFLPQIISLTSFDHT